MQKKGQEMADLPYFSDEGVSCAAHTVMRTQANWATPAPAQSCPGFLKQHLFLKFLEKGSQEVPG